MNHKIIQKRIAFLDEHLNLALKTATKKFHEINTLKKQGLYIIYRENKVVYIGKTGRTGKTRLQEMASDYRSHTLNKKLLKEHFETKLGQTLAKFNKKTKQAFISQAIITLEEFIEGQQTVNNYIRTELKFKFYEFENVELASLEHFAIAVFNPKYND